jgi:class 3 adenylate cyclase
MLLENFINSFIPQKNLLDEWTFRKHRLFVSVSFISALYALFFLPTSLLENYYGAVYVILFFMFWNALFPFILRSGISLTILAYAYILVLALSLSAIMYISGGVYHTATDPQLMVLLPVMALLFINFRAALLWFFIAVAIVATFGAMQLYGVSFDIKMNYKYIQLQNLLAVCGHIVLVFMVINIFEKQKNLAFGRLLEKNKIIEKEKQRSDELLLNILPSEVVEELKETGKTTAKNYDLVTVLFADFVDFTTITEEMEPEELVSGIDDYFQLIDNIITRYNVEKIKTVGDAYICAAGLGSNNSDNPVLMVNVALDIFDAIHLNNQKRKAQNKVWFEMRIGIHSGPVVAGVVGIKKFSYDIWGDTVNTAARMQQHGEPGKINISSTTHDLIKHRFDCIYRGRMEAKHKGLIDMYFVEGKKHHELV